MDPLTGLVLAVALAAPSPISAQPASPVQGVVADFEASPRGRLWQLLTASAFDAERRPTSPRFLGLQSPGLRGFSLLIGWSFSSLSSGDEEILRAVETTLGGEDGWLAARLVRTKRADEVNVWLERRGEGAWFGVEVTGSKRSATKDLEFVVLETLSVFAAHAAPAGASETKPIEPAAGLSPEVVGRAVRRLLPPASRAVVEVQPPDPPVVRRVSKAPVRHVVERGDTLTHIARRHGLDLDALVKLNGIDPNAPIHPGEELQVSDKRRRPKLYVVKQGDTLAKVARRFGVSEARLLEVNRLTVRKVEKGQKLVLPQ